MGRKEWNIKPPIRESEMKQVMQVWGLSNKIENRKMENHMGKNKVTKGSLRKVVWKHLLIFGVRMHSQTNC